MVRGEPRQVTLADSASHAWVRRGPGSGQGSPRGAWQRRGRVQAKVRSVCAVTVRRHWPSRTGCGAGARPLGLHLPQGPRTGWKQGRTTAAGPRPPLCGVGARQVPPEEEAHTSWASPRSKDTLSPLSGGPRAGPARTPRHRHGRAAGQWDSEAGPCSAGLSVAE